jgi:hypothetical protein
MHETLRVNSDVMHFQCDVIFTVGHIGYLKVWGLKPQCAEPIWMGLVLTLRQLSAISCATCRSTSLAVEDVTRFSWIASGMQFTDFVPCKAFKFVMILMSIDCTKDMVLSDRTSSWVFFKNQNRVLLHNYQEPVKLSLISIIIPCSTSLATSYKF